MLNHAVLLKEDGLLRVIGQRDKIECVVGPLQKLSDQGVIFAVVVYIAAEPPQRPARCLIGHGQNGRVRIFSNVAYRLEFEVRALLD